ncbi:TlpA family protein disulfide reductase [Chryseobacterium sp. CBSDS_008]|uniref:TlpA family protein disulfide reductase n=1 Tax=Chryseobacterium sp. CBSDS_008 TaxID=3415265 RepID=UPI003CF8F00D
MVCLGMSSGISGQAVSMYFPHFAGKSYDFIVFQGKDTRVQKGVIPSDGRFTLTVPRELSPYRGMSRWLITGTQEGGGLDMIIPGHDFSVQCTASVPDNKNIVYKDNDENSLLGTMYNEQSAIVGRFTSMVMAGKAYPKDHKQYGVFTKELGLQKDRYAGFEKALMNNKDYASAFLRMVNLTNGLGRSLQENEDDNKKELIRTITQDIPWEGLYTSGHWDGVLAVFTDLEDKKDGGEALVNDFQRIGDKISDHALYTAFAERVTYYLTQSGNDDIIARLSPVILNSGKITSYSGIMSVYQKAVPGSKAPELSLHLIGTWPEVTGKMDFTDTRYQKTLLVFYSSGCGHCDEVMKTLAGKLEDLNKSKVRVMAISADTDRKICEQASVKLPWKGMISCDTQGMKGINFMNYGVQATPTLFIVDQWGNITSRLGSADDALKALTDPSTELWRKIRRPPRPYVPPQL